MEVPQIGFGTMRVQPDRDVTGENTAITAGVVKQAIEAGYRHVDTAQGKGTERGLGEAIRASDLPREDFFVTTKLADLLRELVAGAPTSTTTTGPGLELRPVVPRGLLTPVRDCGVPSLTLINGAPGSGKSTVAAEIASRRPLTLCLDVDQIKHNLGHWDQDPSAAGLQARRLALAMARQHLLDGHSVVLGQYLARTTFIEQLDDLAQQVGATFHEVLLLLEPQELTQRLHNRHAAPTRPEHRINNTLVAPQDADDLLATLTDLPTLRPNTLRIRANGTPADVADQLMRSFPDRDG